MSPKNTKTKTWKVGLIINQSLHLTPLQLQVEKKSRIRETKHLLTDADSSTDTTIGWTKKTQKPKFVEKETKSSKTQKLKNI